LERNCHVAVEAKGAILVLTQPPKVTLQASATPARLWFQLLASYARTNLVFEGPDDPITLDLHAVHWMTAIETTAAVYGYTVTEVKGQSLVRIAADEAARAKKSAAAPKSVAAGPEVEVVFASGRKLAVAFEAILAGEGRDNRPWAVLSGRPYQVGDVLRDRN